MMDESKLKALLKEAFLEIFDERPDLFTQMVQKALEHLALLNAIQAGEDSPLVPREKIMRFFKGNV